jgi:tetratricopeptide (TPR) repeat protein
MNYLSGKAKMSFAPPSNEVPENHEREAADRILPSNQAATALENDVSLADSLIWRWQREFYAQRGMKAWTEDMVPNFLTNNPFIAGVYARVAFSFICDCIESESQESQAALTREPLRILELGAGPGKFAYLFLRHLAALLRSQNLPLETVRYCMTDCSEDLIQGWHKNRYLAEFVECGILQFSVFQVGEKIDLGFFREDSSASKPPNRPLVLIANYVFDSLPQDAFVIKEGQISEALITTTTGQHRGDNTEGALAQLQISYKNVAVAPNRYPDQSWNEILELYRTRLSAATVLFPSHALKILQEIRSLTPGRLLVLAGDKGYAHEDVLALSQGPPTLEFHAANCFSQMVNFDAIGKYFQATGGVVLLPDKHFGSLSICGFLAGEPGDQFPATRAAYRETQKAFGPDDLFALMAGLNAHLEEMSVPQILALLRLGCWDPITLIRLFPVIARQIRTVSGERHDLRNAMIRTFANHYPVHPGENVIAFYCGVILLELQFYDDALSMFKSSQQILGPSATTSYNLGLCYEGLGQFSEALACMIEASDLDPTFEPARLACIKLKGGNLAEKTNTE